MLKPDSLMPHAVCWSADPTLIWTMVATNLVTFLSYLTIAATLVVLVRRTRRLIVRDWAYFLIGFALFILACGSTHLLEVVTTWSPIFWVDAWTNIVTALLSGYVAFIMRIDWSRPKAKSCACRRASSLRKSLKIGAACQRWSATKSRTRCREFRTCNS